MPKSDLQSTSLHDIQQTLRKGSTSPYQTQDLYSGSDLRKHVETAHAAYLISPQILPDEKTFTRGAVYVDAYALERAAFSTIRVHILTVINQACTIVTGIGGFGTE